VNDRSFDTIVRDATAGVSRRRSLFALGGAGVVAALASPFAADAKKANSVAAEGKKRGKHKKKTKTQPPPDLCAPQAEECTALVTNLCGGNLECQDSIDCCSFLGTCRASAFIACFVASLSD